MRPNYLGLLRRKTSPHEWIGPLHLRGFDVRRVSARASAWSGGGHNGAMLSFHLGSAAGSAGVPCAADGQPWWPVGLGVDLVHLPRVAQALDAFGERFVQRLFTAQEALDAGAQPVVRVERLAARFAAKEAAIKAFGLAEVGVNWRDLEVARLPDGAPVLRVHGRAAAVLQSRGVAHWALSLSHDGDHAVAVVAIVQPAVPAQAAP